MITRVDEGVTASDAGHCLPPIEKTSRCSVCCRTELLHKDFSKVIAQALLEVGVVLLVGVGIFGGLTAFLADLHHALIVFTLKLEDFLVSLHQEQARLNEGAHFARVLVLRQRWGALFQGFARCDRF